MRTAEQEMLHHWLQERALDTALANGDSADSAQSTHDTAVLPRPSALVSGQIRLLSPQLATTPRYVAVCSTDADCGTLIPFSRYANPALPGECVTTLDAPPLRVACPWNSINVDAVQVVRMSWLAGELAPEITTDLSDAHAAFHTGQSTGRRDPGTAGPRLLHPGDPRHEYIQEEQYLAAAVSRACGVRTHNPGAAYRITHTDPADRIAAEGRTPYGQTGRMHIAGTVLSLKWDTSNGMGRVQDKDGALTEHFDGCWLQTADGDCSSQVWHGTLQVPAALIETSIRIVRPEGLSYQLLRL